MRIPRRLRARWARTPCGTTCCARSFGQDGNFSHDALVTRYNWDLANGLGNLASRTLTMIARYCEGQVPAPSPHVSGDPEALLADALTEAIRATTKIRGAVIFARARNDLERGRSGRRLPHGAEALDAGC